LKDKLYEAKIVTNKQPSDEILQIIKNNKISWNDIPNDKKTILINQIGSEENCKLFFDNCTFEFLNYDLISLDEDLFNEYSVFSDAKADWCFFKEFIRSTSLYSNNKITLEILTNILQCRPPKPLDQEFFIPQNYIPPNMEFHKNIIEQIKNSNEKCFILTGSPGVGKSTYISYLKTQLEKDDIFVIRHHYYISVESKNEKRYRYFDIKNSLLEQTNNIFSMKFTNNDELEKVLIELSKNYKDRLIVIIIDGLDHVWRDIGKKDDLDTLFNNLFPLPDNIKLIVGTQPIDSGMLPYKLLDIEREKWYTLPFMSIESIRNYLINDNRISVPNNYYSDYYTDISEAFYKLTNGHPLHLIYSIEAALNNNLRLLPFDIEKMPICPQNDIREYYKELLNKVDEYSKLVLYIYIVSEIDIWKKSDLEECLTQNGISDALKYYNQIRHLLFNNGYFIKAFHESIFVYIKEHITNEEQIKCLKYIKKWISTQKENIFTDLYLPLIKARLGEYSDVLDISKDKIKEYFKKGYSFILIIKFLTRAEQITFFYLNDFVKTIELRHLKNRLRNSLEFNTYRAELFCHLYCNLYKNQYAINYMFDSLNSLSSYELVSLSDFCQNKDIKIKEIFRQIKLKYKKVSVSQDTEDNNLLHVLANSSNISEIQEKLIDANYENGLIFLFNHLCALKRTHLIKNFISKNASNYIIIRRLCLYAIEQKIDLTSWGLSENILKNPYLALMLYLDKNFLQTNVNSLENSIVHKRKNEDYEYSGRCPDLENYFHSLFFENLYNKLTKRTYIHKFETYNGFENFVITLIDVSNTIAEMIKKSQEINLNNLLAFFENFSESDILNEVRWNSKYRIVCSSITKIITDLLILLKIDNKKLDEKDIASLINFKHFHEANWIEDYFENNIKYLTENAVKFYLKKEQGILDTNLQYTQERTDQYLILAKFAQIHEIIDDAKLYLDKAFCMAMGYGYHKDPLLFEVLKIVEYCMDVEKTGFDGILKKLARIIINIEYVTDKNSNYAKKIFMRLFCKYSYEYVVKYYNYLLDKEEWHSAKECLNEVLENINFNDQDVELLLETITSDNPFFNYAHDSKTIIKHKNLVGRPILKEENKYSSNDNFLHKENVIFDYEKYPVDKLNDFISKLDYSNEYCLLDWLKHWRGRGYDMEILDFFEKFYNIKKNFIKNLYLDEIFDIALSLNGKDFAYIWLIRSIIENLSWEEHYSSWENTKNRFQIVKDLYKNKWKDFIIDSSEYKYGNEFSLGKSHLVYFLIQMDEFKLAKQIMYKFINLLEDDMADLPLKEVDWL
ncbi:AAA family ATPase, partial [bacterium]|nr:AAA family ATPase [bacterium]